MLRIIVIHISIAAQLALGAFTGYRPLPARLHKSVSLQLHDARGGDYAPLDPSAGNRRSFLSQTAAAAAAAAVAGKMVSPVLAAEPTTTSSDGPICVIGANGRTGCECVGALVERGVPVRATSRSGSYTASPGSGSNLVTEMACDVTAPEMVAPAVRGASAVIFAASASKEGGTPSAVDNAGLVRVAEACLSEGVPHLVIVSSGAVTKPFSPVYLFLNIFGNIMEEKIRGEDAVRALYARHNMGREQELAYTVIRPGGLTTDPPLGATALELNQGDTKSGRISRADVAALCVEAVRYPQYTSCVTFECYDSDTGAPLASVGLSNIMKAKTDDKAFVSGRECQGETWEKLFSGLERD